MTTKEKEDYEIEIEEYPEIIRIPEPIELPQPEPEKISQSISQIYRT